jgi:hypothetical protein
VSKQNENKEEIIPSSPSTIQRETYIILTNSVSLVDMIRDIAVGNKSPA